MKKFGEFLKANNYRVVKRGLIVTAAVAAGVGVAFAIKSGVLTDKTVGDLTVVES